MNDVFISYKIENRKIAIEYYKTLKTMGINAWIDQLIPKNRKWDKEIKDNIINSKLVLCIISKDVVNDKKWLVNQIGIARKNHKRIIFINIDGTDVKLFKKLNIKEEVFNCLEDINIQNYFKEESIFDDYVRLSDITYRKLNKPFLISCLISILCIITFFYGIDLFNLRIDNSISYLFIGVLGMFGLSLIPYKNTYFVNGFISVVLLTISMYVIPKFVITDISIIPLIFLMVYYFVFFVRYSNLKSYALNILVSLFYSLFLVAFTGSVNIFFIYLFDLDVSIFNYVMLIGFIIYNYLNANSHFNVYKEFKYVDYIMNGKNLVEKVEYEDEN